MTEWTRYWYGMGDLRTRQGDSELEAGRFNQACGSYLSATEHYWLALSRTSRCVPDRRVLTENHVSAFRAAIPLLPHPATPFDLDVDGTRITGYLFLPARAADLYRVAIWPVGAEATAESDYRQVALPILHSGLACAVFAPVESCELSRHEPERADLLASAVARWALRQPGVDPAAEPLHVPPRSSIRPAAADLRLP